ncbi:MAG TPA: hypothetical protein VFI31_04365 [Pirellulales bacterium]|nr:hypothetical protein [Pirellulales bacterium]
MRDDRQDAPNPFQPPLRLAADTETHVPLWRLVVAGAAGLTCGGLAGDLIASALFPIETSADLQAVMRNRRAGERLTVSLVRDDKRLTADVQLMDVYAMDEAVHDPPAKSR